MVNYFDKSRPTLFADTYCLQWPHGQGQPLPSFYCEPVEDAGNARWRIGIMCKTSPRGSSYRFTVVDDLQAFGLRWLASPEDVLRAEFAYDGTFEPDPGAAVTADMFG